MKTLIFSFLFLGLSFFQSERQILRDRLNNADMVVMGKIVSINPVDTTLPNSITETEHNADWHWASLEIEEFLKPKNAEFETLKILFPKSEDVAWYGYPRFKEGGEGIYILRWINFPTRRINPITKKLYIPRALMAISKIDVQPKSKYEEIKRLIINYPPR